LLLMNAGSEDANFTLPQPAYEWSIAVDSADPSAPDRKVENGSFTVGARAAVLLTTRFTAEAAPT
jgi:isoamylase